jgi:hypothetical protein
MTCLTLHAARSRACVTVEASNFRVAGGLIWNRIEGGLLARFCDGYWIHERRKFSTLIFDGRCRLLFGISRNPSGVSDPVGQLSISQTTLMANGIAFASYIPDQDIWQGIVRPMSWSTFRIVDEQVLPALVDETRISLLNPWQAAHGTIWPAIAPATQPAAR